MTWQNLLVDQRAARDLSGIFTTRQRCMAAPNTENRLTLLADAFASGRRLYAMADGIAIIPVKGFLDHDWPYLDTSWGITGYDAIDVRLSSALADPDVRGIMLHISSFGGVVAGCMDLADRIRAARDVKPIWALANEWAYSAAYALASQASRIIVPRTGGLGSIGVVTSHIDISGALEQAGVKVTLLHAGEHKTAGHPYGPLPESVAAEILEEMEVTRKIFAETVAAGRGLNVDAVLDTEARTYRSDEAVAIGLADAIMPAREALPAFALALAAGEDSDHPAAKATTIKEKRMTTKQKRRTSGAKPKIRAEDMPPEDDDQDVPEEDEEADADAEAEDTEATDAEDAAATDDAATEDAEPAPASASARERKRIQAITMSKEAKGRESLARHFAFNTGMSAKDAVAALAAAPKASASRGHLGGLMPDNPRLGADGGQVPKAGSSWAASADRVFGKPNTTR